MTRPRGPYPEPVSDERATGPAGRGTLRLVLLGLAGLLLAGLLGMHAPGAAGAPGEASSLVGPVDVADAALVSGPAGHHVTTGLDPVPGVTTGGPGEPATQSVCAGLGGTCGALAGACLTLLGGVLLWARHRPRVRGPFAARPRLDALAALTALAVSVAAHARIPARPDQHALSVLRC